MSQGTFDGVFAAGGPVTLYGWMKPTARAAASGDTLPRTGEAAAIITAFPEPGPAGGEGGIFNAIPPTVNLNDYSSNSDFALGTVLGLPDGWMMAVTTLSTGPPTTQTVDSAGPFTFSSYYNVKIVITPPTAQSVVGNFLAGYARRELPTVPTVGGYTCALDYALVLTETPWEGPTSGAPPTPPPPYNPFGAAPVALDPYALINTYDYYVSGVRHVDAYQRGHFALGYALGLAPDGHTLRLTVPAGDVAGTWAVGNEQDFAAQGPPTDTEPSGAEFAFGLWVLAQDSAPHTTSTPSGGALSLTHNAAGQQTGPHLLYIPAQPTPGASSATAAAFALDLTTTLLSIAGTAYTLTPIAQGWDALGGAYIITGLNTAANVSGSLSEATPFTEGVTKAAFAAVSAYGYSANPLYGYVGAPCLDAALTYTVPGGSSSSSSSSSSGGPPSGVGFDRDGHRRPAWAFAGSSSSLFFQTTADGGSTYSSHYASATGTDPNLLIDRRLNRPRLIWGASGGLLTAAATVDGENGDWPVSVAVAGISGAFPTCAPHPTDPLCAALCYLSGGALRTALTYDGGVTFVPNSGSVASGLDFSTSGRAGLGWLGETLCCAYWDGARVAFRSSPDRGQTWGAATTITSSAANSLSLQSFEGALYLLATAPTSPALWRSGDVGATWQARPAPPGLCAGAALGVLPALGRLLLWTMALTDTDGADYHTN